MSRQTVPIIELKYVGDPNRCTCCGAFGVQHTEAQRAEREAEVRAHNLRHQLEGNWHR